MKLLRIQPLTCRPCGLLPGQRMSRLPITSRQLSTTIAPCATAKVKSGPMPFTNYEEVAAFAEPIRFVTAEKIMPPWPPDRSFSRFVGERGLTDDQIQLINDWVDGGSLRGDPDKEPPLPDFPEGSVLGKPDLVLTVDNSYTIKGNGTDEYRVFVLPTNLTEDKDVVAVEFRPGNAEIVHHAVMTYDTNR